ncbi:Nucleosome assembly protein [Entamoeba marina]
MTDYVELLNAETYEEYLKLVNVEVHQNIHMCQNIAKDYLQLRIQAEKEKHEAEMKLHEAAKPYYERRRLIVNAIDNPSNEEIAGYVESTENPPNDDSEYKTGVPCFWLHVLKNAQIFDTFEGNDEDAPILTHLHDIRLEYYPTEDTTLTDGTPSLLFTYRVIFVFNDNPYLRTREIPVKITYKLSNVEGETEEPSITVETAIDWVKDKDPRFKMVKRKTNKKSYGKYGSQQKQKVDSFFDIFYISQLSLNTGMNDDGSIEEELLKIHDVFEMFMCLITEVIPAAVNYFDESLIEENIEDIEDIEDDADEFVNPNVQQPNTHKETTDDQNAPARQECNHQ